MSRRNTRRNPIPPGGEEVRVERANAPAVAIAATAPNEAVPVEDFGIRISRTFCETFSQKLLQGMEKMFPTFWKNGSYPWKIIFL